MRLKALNILLHGTLILLSLTMRAQFIRFKHLNVDDGLSNNEVYVITQDKKGFIWSGTENGINKYDGYKITTYPFDAEDSTGISAPQIRSLFADDNDKLWIGTFKGGLCYLNLRTNKFKRFLPDSSSKNTISSDAVSGIVELDNNTLALSTANGLNIFDKKTETFKQIYHSDKNKNSLLADNIRSITKDKKGNLWLAHYYDGLTYYDIKTQTFTRYTQGTDNKHLKVLFIKNIFMDSEGLLWISNWQAGITVLDTKTGIFHHNRDTGTLISKQLHKIGLVFKFYEDKDKNIWFATAENGICRFNKKTGEIISFKNNPDDPETLGDNTAFTVFEDNTGTIWAGTWRDGLNYFGKKSLQFGYYKHEKNAANTLVNNHVYCFEKIGNNELLIGTGATPCTFNTVTKSFTPFYINKNDPASILEQTEVTCLLKDSDGSIWIGSDGGGAYRYFPKTKKYKNYNSYNNETDPTKLSAHTPIKMVLDHYNQVWIATSFKGLNLYNREKDNFVRFAHNDSDPKSIPSNHIFCMVKDKKGMIWLGTEDNGLIKLDPGKKEFYVKYNPNSIKMPNGISINNIYIDKEGWFWMTSSIGLIKYNPENGEATRFSEKAPEFKKQISTISGDDIGNIWLATTSELYRYNQKTEKLTSFYPEDGTQGKEFSANAELKLTDGKLFLGGSNGFNFFDPQNLTEDKTPPLIALTDFRVLNKPYPLPLDISLTDEITLSYKDYFFSVDFSAMNFLNPMQNKFKYKLTGFNDDWVDIGTQHSLTFTNLDPGKYTLNIIAADHKGNWNKNPLQLTISITPPFWKTTWFYFLCVLTGLFSFYAFIKFREKQLVKEKTKLEEKVMERTEELHVEKLKVEEAHKDIKDSILYAQKIQRAILPTEEEFKQLLPGSFIFFKPKDIVSGDFYWLTQKENYVFYAVADCTGHGVPGGFMTMLSNGLLNEIVNEHNITEPGDILNKLREKIITSLKQTGKSGENKDGMDIILFRINKKTNELCYAAANNGFIIINNGCIKEYKGDKQPVGIYGEDLNPFSQYTVNLKKGDSIFSYTDGYPDQFGGPKGKKYKYKALNELLLSVSDLDGFSQREKLEKAFYDWKGELEQIDDVCVIGVKV